MLTGALSDREREFCKWVPGKWVGGEGDEDGEHGGEGQYSSKLIFFLRASENRLSEAGHVDGEWSGG